MGVSALRLADVTSGYGESMVLRNLSLDVGKGESIAILGKNGMGKTTLLKNVMGLLTPQRGTISLFGEPITGQSAHRIARSGVAYCPQEFAIFHELSVKENLQLALQRSKIFPKAFSEISEFFPVLGERLNQKAGTLSGGEQKMLLVARAFIARPRIVLMDEITEGLQPSVIDRVANIIRAEAHRLGVTVIVVEQNVKFACTVAERYMILTHGEFVSGGSMKDADAERQIVNHLRI